ncbi:hypothetical protein T01_1037 [Trichinella spiralis]|uniref:Uncharacterized protein n=1 Tax=Trichinella spiralis TaxID=6334 RepID=A0A0V1BKS2_TRISP|nr:hypothetical protein T01_1037 [Trichinella spiralis]
MIRGQQRGQLGRSCRLMRRMDIDFVSGSSSWAEPVVNRLTNENDPLDCNSCLNVVQLCLANYRPSALRIYATIASSACENAELTHPLGAPHEKSVLLIETNFLVNAMIMLKLNPIIFEWLQLNDYAHQEASLITQK